MNSFEIIAFKKMNSRDMPFFTMGRRGREMLCCQDDSY
jgi:hypothetical protein